MCQLTIFTEKSNKEVIPPILGKDTSVIESSPENEKNTVCDLIPKCLEMESSRITARDYKPS